MSSNPAILRHLHNGWTPGRQQRFPAHLALHGSIAPAVRRRPADVRLRFFHLKRAERRKIEASQRRTPPESSNVAKLRAELRNLAAGDD